MKRVSKFESPHNTHNVVAECRGITQCMNFECTIRVCAQQVCIHMGIVC